MDKFGRNYQLQIGDEFGNTLTIQLPFTVEFDIIRNTLTSANVCQLRIYNLSEKNRNFIRFNVSNIGTFRPILFKAGYGLNLPTIFTGNISQAWSVREGVNFITQIECYDGGFAFVNGNTNTSFPSGTPFRGVIQNLGATMPHLSLGAVGDYPGTLSRGNSYSGNTAAILASDLTGGGFFVDNGKVNALGTDEFIEDATTLVINNQSGLLGTPLLEQTIVHFDMLFEPYLQPGRKILLQSLTEKNFNGSYKVTGVKHRGMISSAVCGEAVTTGQFFYTKILKGVSSG